MIVFQVSLSFDLVKKTEKNTEESDYSEEHTSDNENFCSTILQPFHIESEQKKTCGNDSRRKKLNIFTFSCRFITYWNRTLQKQSERNRLSLL